ncbi:MAG: hypothetical protein ACKO96_05315, partial [Flammeovirgaceae bacterium]
NPEGAFFGVDDKVLAQGECPGCQTANNLLLKLYLHFQFGGGEDFLLDASTLDFSKSNQRLLGLDKLKKEHFKDPVNLFVMGKFNPIALGFGRVRMTRVSDTEFSIANNRFDFDPLYDPT